jgi:hypothetical protein
VHKLLLRRIAQANGHHAGSRGWTMDELLRLNDLVATPKALSYGTV